MESVGYDSIPQRKTPDNISAASPCEHGSDHMKRRFNFPRVGSKIFPVLGIATALVAVIFLADNYGLQLPRFNNRKYDIIPRLSNAWNPKPLRFDRLYGQVSSHGKYSDWKARSSRPWLNSAIRSDICDVDSVTEEAVMTRDCTVGLQCRGRVVVTKDEAGIKVQAGYYIFTKRSTALPITRTTKDRVLAVTLQEATSWAETLLEQLGSKLEDVDCGVSASMIANAILETKDVVASCENTNDAHCGELVTIKECSCKTGPAFEHACYNFLTSDAAIGSFEDLVGGCADAMFFYNRIGVSLPFCTFTCASDPGVIHTFDADFHVQGGNQMSEYISSEDKKQALAVSMRPAYENLYLPLPECEHAPPLLQYSGDTYMHTIYNDGRDPEPEFFKSLTAELRMTYNFVYFTSHVASRADYINSVCSTPP